MATAIATPFSKTEQAAALRNEAAILERELSKLRADLGQAQQQLGAAEDKRRKLVEAAARGESVKSTAVAAIEAEIDAAKIGVEAFAPSVASKAARLDAVRAELQAVDHELAIEAQQQRRRERFDVLTKQAHEAADVIAGKIRTLLETDFPAFDQIRDQLRDEFIGGQFSMATGPEPQAARALLHALDRKLRAVDQVPAAERELLRHSDSALPWTVRGDIVLQLRNLNKPKR